MPEISIPITLKLHAHGLKRITDPDWTGLDLFYLLKKPVRRNRMLLETQKEGLLYHLGLWLFREYILEEGERASGPFLNLRGNYLAWYLEDMLDMLLFHGIEEDHPLILEKYALLETLMEEWDTPPDQITLNLESKKGQRTMKRHIVTLRREFSDLLRDLASRYAEDYAQRVFHDREFCAYLSELVVTIGYPGKQDETGEPWQWAERRAFPEWAKRAVIARDRGRCAECGDVITMELEAKPNIDHIIPLAVGGSNDIVNLQLLCQTCNLKKNKNQWPVKSSIPRYLQRKTS